MKSTINSILDVIRVVNGLDRNGRLQVFRYLYKEFENEPRQAVKPERKKRVKGEEEKVA